MNKKIFVMSWFYPPINSSESFVTYKLLSHSKFDYDVWTRENINSEIWDRRIDESKFDSENIEVFRMSCQNIDDWLSAAYKYFIEHADEYIAVMTRSMPAEAHEFGKKIKKKFPNIKWIASYGDPLIGTPYLGGDQGKNPYLLKKYIEKEHPSKLKSVKLAISPMRNAQKMIWKKERKAIGEDVDYSKINDYTIQLADLVLINNNYQKKHIFSGKYEKFIDKCLIVPHSFDMALYAGIKRGRNKKIVFSYTGHLDTIRSATIFLKALNRMLKKDPELYKKAEINFYGHLSDDDKLYIINNGLYELVKIKESVSYKESLKIMVESDVLLLFDANFNGKMSENIYFPAKLADYIGSGTPIMAITQIEGVSADIVRDMDGIVCTHSEDEIMMYLSKIIYKKYKLERADKNGVDRFDANYVARGFDLYLEGILK